MEFPGRYGSFPIKRSNLFGSSPAGLEQVRSALNSVSQIKFTRSSFMGSKQAIVQIRVALSEQFFKFVLQNLILLPTGPLPIISQLHGVLAPSTCRLLSLLDYLHRFLSFSILKIHRTTLLNYSQSSVLTNT